MKILGSISNRHKIFLTIVVLLLLAILSAFSVLLLVDYNELIEISKLPTFCEKYIKMAIESGVVNDGEFILRCFAVSKVTDFFIAFYLIAVGITLILVICLGTILRVIHTAPDWPDEHCPK